MPGDRRPIFRRRGPQLIAVLAFTVMVGFLFARRVAVHRRREAARQHLSAVLDGLFLFDDNNGRLPHAVEVEPEHSWRFVAIRLNLGMYGVTHFYGQAADSAFDEAWDSSANRRYHAGPHQDFPGSPASLIDPTREGGFTRFAAITGPGTAFDGGRDVALAEVPADTILVVEVGGSGQHWMEPGGDLDVMKMPRRIGAEGGISGADTDGFLVGFADGDVWLISNDVPFADLELFFRLSSARRHSKNTTLGKYRL